MQLGWGHRLTSAALWMYSLVFVVLALQPAEMWGQSGSRGNFSLLGLAFALGSSFSSCSKQASEIPSSSPLSTTKGPLWVHQATTFKVRAESPEPTDMRAASKP